MRDELGSSIDPTSTKKKAKSRRRLHEAEVLSTTPCTAPLRKPQQNPIVSTSVHSRSLYDHELPQHHQVSSVTSSVGGTIHEYNRISNKTGGFEGALPLQYDAIFPEEDTVHFTNTVKSSPELGKGKMQLNNGRDTTLNSRRRLFHLQRRLSFVDHDNQSKKLGFFKRWTSIGSSSKDRPVSTSATGSVPRSIDKQQNPTQLRPPKLRLSSRATTTVTIEDSSERSIAKIQYQIATPARSIPLKSPRFILPDETPTGSERKRNRNNKGSTSDHTSAAVVARRSQSSQISDDQGFELSISSAPATYSTPRKQRNLPVDLDEVDGESSSDGSAIRKLNMINEEDIRKQQHGSGGRSSSLSPTRRRLRKSPNSPIGLGTNMLSKSTHTRFGMSIDTDDELSKFSAQHLGSIETASNVRQHQRQSSSESDWSKGYSGLKKWILPTKRVAKYSSDVDHLTANEAISNTSLLEKRKNIEKEQINNKSEQDRKPDIDEVQSLSPDQRESIFANMELVEKESGTGERTKRSTVKSTSYTQSTTSSSKDAMKLPRCVVCNFYDRTHIAVPCMHFAYCRECSMRLAKLGKGCILCHNQYVTFAAVSV
jgi:Zinc finger, C3HC4 type (RING finger)